MFIFCVCDTYVALDELSHPSQEARHFNYEDLVKNYVVSNPCLNIKVNLSF